MTFTPETPVGQIVAAHPLLAKVFEKHGIDYCCGGKLTLAFYCGRKGLDAGAVLAELDAALATAVAPEVDWKTQPLSSLIDHIVETHHAFTTEALPRLAYLAEKVARVHGDHHPELIEVDQVYRGMAAELSAHLEKEEQVLFPAIARLELGMDRFPVNHPIRVMEAEHEDAGAALERIRELTDGYTPPDDACNSYRALFAGLAELELDLFTHIHKENNILFPRALALLEATPA